MRLAENMKVKPNADTRTLPRSLGYVGTSRSDKCLIVLSFPQELRPGSSGNTGANVVTTRGGFARCVPSEPLEL
jgi:hypothetical protein